MGPVWSLDQTHDQVMLSACSGYDGKWVLSKVSDMAANCGGYAPRPAPAPSPPAPPAESSCTLGKKGPKCASTNDCIHLGGCLRCAKSGFCTDQPLPDADDLS